MYSNSFAGHTQTFIGQDVIHLSKKHHLLYLCNTIHDSQKTSSDKIKVIPKYSMSFIQKLLWKYDIRLDCHNRHFKKQLNAIINEHKPDVIHCQFGIEAIYLIDNLKDTSIPLVIQFRGFDASSMLRKNSYVKRLQEILDRKNYYSIFVSNSLKHNLQKYHINVTNSMILYSGIDLDKFTRKNKKSNSTFIFLQVSSLVEKKGHEYTLRAFAEFLRLQQSKNFKLILTGDGERKDQLQELCNDLNIADYVEFVGFVSPLEAKELMQNANVFVHHSITPENGDEEGIPNALMEAMAMELPVLSTYHAGIPELVQDGIHGYLVKEKDIHAYAQRMSDILSWDKMRINRDVIEEKFEINKHIKKLEAFYKKMLLENKTTGLD